ncbi:SDR family oxidoreductase, partial [Halomonas sp. BC04]|uniref:SDR family oxidoreductase n=1 Tax=Halomonas sp. BC04 TaxID=1403540 RepID=UPI0003ED8AC9
MVALSGKRVIWLTGATSGIGRALAIRLLDEGHHVAISARSLGDLTELAGDRSNALLLPLDVSDREAVRAAGIHLDDLFGRLDLVIFNAGTCEYVDVRQFDLDLVQRVFAPTSSAS